MVNETALSPQSARKETERRLAAAGCPDADVDAQLLVSFVLGGAPLWSVQTLTAEQQAQLAALTARRAAREPLQYLLKKWAFLDFELAVGPGVLCPRSDTEVVAQAAADACRAGGNTAPRVLDLCAGTGALGLGIRRFLPDARVTCVEKSPAALAYLKQNTAALVPLGIPAPAVTPVAGDLFAYYRALPPATLDMIVCNPPYLTGPEMHALQPEVAQEPAIALDGGSDGLVFYRALAEHYRQTLKPGGLLALEIGWQQREAVTALLAENGWTDIRCVRDYGGNDRCILARA